MRSGRAAVLIAALALAMVGTSAPSHAALGPNMPAVASPANAGGYASLVINMVGKADPLATVRVVDGTPPCPAAGCTAGPVLGSQLVGVSGAFNFPVTFASVGYKRIYVYANNGINDGVPLARDFQIDLTAPIAPTIDTPAGGETYNSTVVEVSGTGEPGAHVVLVDQIGHVRSTTGLQDGTWLYRGVFSNGAQTLYAYQEDLASNLSASSATVSFTVAIDVTPPAAPAIDTPVQNGLTAAATTFTGSAEPYSTVEILEDRPAGFIVYTTAPADAAGRWTATVTLLDGLHFVQARATDAAGNLGPRSGIREWRVDALRPYAAMTLPSKYVAAEPYFSGDTIAGIATDNNGVVSVSVTFTNVITHTVDETDAAVCAACPATNVRWTVTGGALLPGLYRVDAYATDLVGNVSAPGRIYILAVGI